MTESWSLKGELALSCSCTVFCPCVLSRGEHPPTESRCQTWAGIRIDDGHFDTIDLSGIKAGVMMDLPGIMSRGNWTAALFVDENASDEQMEKLTAVFGGQKGGPMEGLAPLIGEMLGVERVPIEVVNDGLRHSVRIGDAVDFEIEDIVPFGVETGQPVKFSGMFHPAGSDLTMAEAKRSRISAFGIEYEGKTGLSKSDFAWAA